MSFIRVASATVLILAVSFSCPGLRPQENPAKYAAEYPNSADGLKTLFQDIIVAVMYRDGKKETELIRGLILPNETPWFKEAFGPDLAEQVSSDYKAASNDIESTVRRVIEADIREGKIALEIKTITDPKSFDPPIVNILHDMEPLQPLYEVNLSGRKHQWYELQFDTKGKSFQSSGDPDGYFFYINERFRFVPTNAFVNLPDGRPAPGQKQPLRPKLLSWKPAVQPQSVQKAKISGTVRLHVIVGADGKVLDVIVKDGDPRLTKAAVEAVRKWVFHPPEVDGKPIQSEIDVEMPFQFY
jgi:TonB family protein